MSGSRSNSICSAVVEQNAKEIAGFAVQLGPPCQYKSVFLTATFSNAIKLPEIEGMPDGVYLLLTFLMKL